MKMVCPNCRKEYRDAGAYCPVCDAALVQVNPWRLAARIAVSMVIFFIICAFLTVLASALTARAIFDKENAAAIADELDILSLPAEGSFHNGELTEGDTLQMYIFSLYEGDSLELGDIRTIYERSDFPELVKDQITGYMRYIAYDEDFSPLTAEKLKAAFEKNLDVINSVADKPLTEEELEQLYANIDDMAPALEDMSPQAIRRDNMEFLLAVRKLCSDGFLIMFILFTLAAMLLLLAINRGVAPMLWWSGTAALMCGGAILLITIALTGLASDVYTSTGVNALKCVVDAILPDVRAVGGIFAGAGFVMIIIGNIIKKSARGASMQ